MNLKVIHIVFVSSAVLLALFFGGWCLAQGAEFFALGVGSFVVAAALVVYGFWFWRKITTPEEEWNRRRKLFRTVPAVVGLWLFGSEQAAWACSVLLRRRGRLDDRRRARRCVVPARRGARGGRPPSFSSFSISGAARVVSDKNRCHPGGALLRSQ